MWHSSVVAMPQLAAKEILASPTASLNSQIEPQRVPGTVIIVTYQSREKIGACLRALLPQATTQGLKVLVIDNASPDRSADYVAENFPEVQLISNTVNVGFGAACNQGFAVADGEFVFLLNPDALLASDCIEKAIAYLRDTPSVGILGGKLLEDSGEIAPSARRFPSLLNKFLTLSGLSARFRQHRWLARPDYGWFDHDRVITVDWVPGAFTAIRRRDLASIGGFDERFFLYFEEVDLCRRFTKAGTRIVFHPDCVVQHEGGASSRKVAGKGFDEAGAQLRPFRLRSECLYHRKHGGLSRVLTEVGFEWLWHGVRFLANLGAGARRRAKRQGSSQMMEAIRLALHETNWGRTSPQAPW